LTSLYANGGKRLLDAGVAGFGLLLLSPVFLLVAAIAVALSRGPVLYVQERVGKGGRIFKIVKFRTMQVAPGDEGPSITSAGDPRITPFGCILRSLKIDELPQLWNVLKGDMSIVGPRPEVPEYVQTYSSEQKQVLAVRPGLTDPSSISYLHEEVLLGDQADPQRYYREVVLPHKLSLSLEYIQRMSLPYDLALITKTLASMLQPRPRFSADPVNR
jgi:lipopolysaccharide/colanic/teichoic acid biosynthesis glycosyltransferase